MFKENNLRPMFKAMVSCQFLRLSFKDKDYS
jgi:hypothetical protein